MIDYNTLKYIFNFVFYNSYIIISHASLRASSISWWDFPAFSALCIIAADNAEAPKSSSPACGWTPNLAANRLTYRDALLCVIRNRLPPIDVNAFISGIIASYLARSSAYLPTFCIPSSIAYWAAAIFALTSSTVSS